MRIFILDIDNTLTPARQPMTEEFCEFFTFFLNRNKVHLISGSDIEKIKEQVPLYILRNTESVHACSGNQIWIPKDGELTLFSEEKWWPGEDLLWELNKILDESVYPLQVGNHIESRVGSLNFSVAGRNSTKSQRDAYEKWDKGYGERKAIVKRLLDNFGHIDCSIGGQISIDIYPKGKDKSQFLNWLYDSKTFFPHTGGDGLVFFGDKCIDGNDKTLARSIIDSDCGSFHNVKDHKETLEILKGFYA